MKILVVEDQPDIRATLQELLEFNGHEVLAAEDGVVGLKLAAQNPDFIFCDMTMPNLDGPGVLAAVKQMPAVRDVPFVFLTARADRTEQREGMALGADDYITKPFTERDLLEAIAARTRRHRSIREQVQQLTESQQRQIHAQWSHELLTPLNAVLGSLDLIEMESDTISRVELKDLLGLIREGAERQERLSRKLINYFGLEQRLRAPAPAKPFRCQADRAVQAGGAGADRKKNPGANLSHAAEPGEVAIDEGSLVIAISEVVGNALNFSPAGATVFLTGACRDGRYRIEITDQGPGLTAEQRASIGAFVQFERKVHEQQGLGLGLAIARATARLAGGSFQLEDPGAGQRGLRAVFDLPLAPPDGP